MTWKCILGDWFGKECNWKVGAILLLALFLCVIYLFCLNNKHHHHDDTSSYQQPQQDYPYQQPQQDYPYQQPQQDYPYQQPQHYPTASPQHYPTASPQQGYPTGTPTYVTSLDDAKGPIAGRYASTEQYSTPNHTIHNIKTTDPDHAAKDIEVHYHSDNNDAHNWPKPTINNQGDLEIKDYGNTMKGHYAVHVNGDKLAHQEVTPA